MTFSATGDVGSVSPWDQAQRGRTPAPSTPAAEPMTVRRDGFTNFIRFLLFSNPRSLVLTGRVVVPRPFSKGPDLAGARRCSNPGLEPKPVSSGTRRPADVSQRIRSRT